MLLEDPRIDINRPKEDGATPLSVAAQNGHLACAERILAFNLSIHYKKKRRLLLQSQKVYGPKVADLIDAFDKDPSGSELPFVPSSVSQVISLCFPS